MRNRCKIIHNKNILNLRFYSPVPLDIKQFLPRGSVLRNEKWIYGVVIYAGQETKLMLNRTVDSLKQSILDKILKVQIKFVLLLAFLLSVVCSIFCTLWTNKNYKSHWYIRLQGNKILKYYSVVNYYSYNSYIYIVI